MINLLPFKIFEAEKKLHPDCQEFLTELEKYPHKNIFKAWFRIAPKSTGNISISGFNLPATTRFKKGHFGDWSYLYSGAGKDYGIQVSDSLQDLFTLMIKDSIKKGAPSYLNRKDIDTILANDEWLFSNITENGYSIYKKIQSKLHEENEIILDFTNLDLPGVKILQDLDLLSKEFKGNLGEISFQIIFEDNKYQSPFWMIANSIVEDGNPDSYVVLNCVVSSITLYPKGSGVSNRKTEQRVQIDIGAKNEQEAVEMIESTITKYMLKNGIVVSGGTTNENRKKINDLYHSFIKFAMEKNDITEILVEYFSKNPLDVWMLDGFPDLKRNVIKKTGIRDLSSIGKLISSGLI